MSDSPARLSPGDPAPDFTLPTDTGEEVTLSSLRGRKVIVYFYPAAMTAGVHHAGLRLHRLPRARCVEPATRSSASPRTSRPSSRSSVSVTTWRITLASDEDRSVMTSYGAFGEKKLYGKVVQGVIRSTIVVDEDGNVELAQYNVKATGHVAKLRRDLGLDAA